MNDVLGLRKIEEEETKQNSANIRGSIEGCTVEHSQCKIHEMFAIGMIDFTVQPQGGTDLLLNANSR